MDGEKVEKVSRVSNASCFPDNGTSHPKTVPSTSLRDCGTGSVDHTRSPGVAIPPLTHNPSAVAAGVSSGMGTIPGVQSYRYELGNKSKVTFKGMFASCECWSIQPHSAFRLLGALHSCKRSVSKGFWPMWWKLLAFDKKKLIWVLRKWIILWKVRRVYNYLV